MCLVGWVKWGQVCLVVHHLQQQLEGLSAADVMAQQLQEKFKDMVKDCDQDRFPNAGGRSGDNEIGFDEGIECLKKYVRSSAIILILVLDPTFTFSLTTKKCLKNVTKTRMADWYVKSSKIT